MQTSVIFLFIFAIVVVVAVLVTFLVINHKKGNGGQGGLGTTKTNFLSDQIFYIQSKKTGKYIFQSTRKGQAAYMTTDLRIATEFTFDEKTKTFSPPILDSTDNTHPVIIHLLNPSVIYFNPVPQRFTLINVGGISAPPNAAYPFKTLADLSQSQYINDPDVQVNLVKKLKS